jgi:hypothetical protein
MNSIAIGFLSTIIVFAGTLLGMSMQKVLPSHHLNDKTQDIVKLSAGTIATLTALVLGLLVSSAKSSFDSMSNGVVQGSAKFILLDRQLARYGPEAKSARDQLKQTLASAIAAVWPTESTGLSAITAFEHLNGMELVEDKLRDLKPENETQRQLLNRAFQLTGELGQAHWLLIEQAQSQLPLPLLVILVFWLALLFMSFGLFAPRNFTVVIVLFVGACAISAAIFLVLELNSPLEGVFKISSAPLMSALRHLGE